jgi:hypothetical protein
LLHASDRPRRQRIGDIHPATPHGLVHVHDLGIAVGVGAHQGEFGSEKLVVGNQHFQVADQTVFELESGQAGKLPQRDNALALQGGAFDRLLYADERIVGFSECIQNRPLVCKLGLQLLRLGRLNLTFDGAGGEDRAGQTRPHRPGGSRTG